MTQEHVDILLVDDNPGKLLALEAALSTLDVRLHKATSGREGLRLLLSHDFALILLDVSMPTMDGFETAELIRGRNRSAHTPIIFITAINQSQDHASRGYRLGAVDYVYAPFLPEVLRAKVSVFVELHRMTLEARSQAEKIAADALELASSNERLRHSERLASLGTLAAGLGHDMANMLLPMRFHLESIKSQTVPPPVLEDVAAVLRCAEYLQRLSHGLRMLALDEDNDSASTIETDLQRWWAGIMPVLRGCLPRGIVLEAQMDAGPARVRIPEHSLSQAVFNLVQNAGDVLRNRSSGRVLVWSQAVGDSGVRLGITDDGPGMPDEVRRHCFEPFFSTKTRGLSTGLGLPLVRTLVTKAGGTVEVESQVGTGTTFVLTLPGGVPRGAGGAGPAQKPGAVVSISDQRLAGFVAAVLSSWGLEPFIGSGAVSHSARLWVVEAKQAQSGALAQFCDADPARRVVVVGSLEQAPATSQVILTGDSPTPAALRQALRRAVDAPGIKTEINGDATPDQSPLRGRQRTDLRGDPAEASP